jgi:MarR family transcriptional regulator, organic hydroperoxide resistance regulator
MTSASQAPSGLSRDELSRLTDAWDEFIVAVRRNRARSGALDRGLSLSQYQFARPLLSGSLPSGRLAERFGIAPATATQIIDGLEREGLVERSRAPGDRRCVTITLTGKGRRAIERKRRLLSEQRRRLFEGLAPEERPQAERVLRHLAQVMHEL